MRTWPIVTGVVVVAGAAIATGIVVAGSDGDDVADASEATAPRSTVPVTRQDLAREVEFDGVVGHGPAAPVVLAGSGTVTWLPSVGDVMDPGDTVVELDGVPVVALAGAFPMWRALGPSVTAGKDVLQLEYTLTSLGYTDDGNMTVDDDWSSSTTRAVKAFQEDHGQDDDGTIDVGDIVWIGGRVRVDSVGGVLGQSAAEAAIEVTAPDQAVLVDADVANADLLAVDTTLDLELPTGETVTGTVSAVGAPTTDEQGTTTMPVEITMATTEPLNDGTPIDVTATEVSASGAIAVPVEAVLALAEGGYALEVVTGDGSTELVGVQLGVFADGYVQVHGDVAEGDEVVVP